MTRRIDLLRAILQKRHLDSLLVSHQPNITYLTDFSSSDSYLLLTPRKAFFITDARFYLQAQHFRNPDIRDVPFHLDRDIDIELAGRSVFDTIADLVKKGKVERLGFEARHLDFAQYQQIKKLIKNVYFMPTRNLIEELRQIKEPGELAKIKTAVGIASEAIRYAKRIIRPGLTEIQTAGELERFIRYKGARNSSFDTIVAAAENSAFPHHLTSNRKIKKNDCLLIDIGVDYQGYKSDLTRTLFLGRIPIKIKKIYAIIHQAQALAINRIQSGFKICNADKAARQYIIKQGYGGFFTHNLGHGIGLEIHEQPYISRYNKSLFKAGMVFTVEPAIYLTGEFGIRIEDDVAITDNGCEVLSGAFDK